MEVPQTVVQTVDRHVPKIEVQEIAAGLQASYTVWLRCLSAPTRSFDVIVLAKVTVSPGEARSEDRSLASRALACFSLVLLLWRWPQGKRGSLRQAQACEQKPSPVLEDVRVEERIVEHPQIHQVEKAFLLLEQGKTNTTVLGGPSRIRRGGKEARTGQGWRSIMCGGGGSAANSGASGGATRPSAASNEGMSSEHHLSCHDSSHVYHVC